MNIDHRPIDMYVYHGARECEMLYEMLLACDAIPTNIGERMCALAASVQSKLDRLADALDPSAMTITPCAPEVSVRPLNPLAC
ncbi:hypothetical protein [Methylobacterium soli]|uniref:Uncharacterized protein n=1 Tax=Methylobacterium soli TaxID=553447 RepID=A0A6L3SRG7_9HYPH|nr:hypothetical protein [Methylobacterium soli]KAB1075396.1 hypothetical protein F6X53_24820 [Methylobacterium soli]GJE43778.1 hypothetical protein AEGHOMDF_2957 [Methylobacterium soli]